MSHRHGSPDFNGDIAEVLLYSVPLTTQQRLDVTEYLYTKWMAPPGECAAGERRGPNGKCYFSSNAAAASSCLDARNTCQARGSGWDLASVRNELDHRFLTGEMLTSGTLFWFGARNGYPDDIWRWSADGSAFWTGKANGVAPSGVFTAWESDQPNDLVNESRCIRYRNAGASWGWSDAACSDLHGYVCEGPASVGGQ